MILILQLYNSRQRDFFHLFFKIILTSLGPNLFHLGFRISLALFTKHRNIGAGRFLTKRPPVVQSPFSHPLAGGWAKPAFSFLFLRVPGCGTLTVSAAMRALRKAAAVLLLSPRGPGSLPSFQFSHVCFQCYVLEEDFGRWQQKFQCKFLMLFLV